MGTPRARGHRRRVVLALASASFLATASSTLLGGGAHAEPFGVNQLNKIQRRLVSGALIATGRSAAATPQEGRQGGDEGSVPGADGAANTPPNGFASAGAAGSAGNYLPIGTGGCATNLLGNIKVNQNCLNVSDADLQGRGQANNETSIAVDPMNPTHLVASNNDYVRGDGTCGAAYSLTQGATWSNSTVPNVFTRGTAFGGAARQYWEASGDTSVAWDTKGNAYLSCQFFNRGDVASSNPDQSSAFAVYRSTGNNGASWNFPGRDVETFFDPDGTAGVLLDKQLMTVDNRVGSPFQDRIYVTWTTFAADGTGYIYESYSSDYAQTFSPRVLVSRTSALCTQTYGLPTPNGTCNENQYSQPFTGPDGSLYVVYNNYNNPVSGADNHNQVLLAKSTDGGVTFSSPVRVGDFYDLPDCDTYQGDGADPGRACVPEKGSSTKSVFRATNYPAGAVSPLNPNQVVVTFGSYINKTSNETNGCVPNGFADSGQNTYTGVKTAGACSNKILVSTSTNGGGSFTGTTTNPRALAVVPQAPAQAHTDQFWQWAAFNAQGKFVVDYYDRQYGDNELTGYSDLSLSSSSDMVTFLQRRVTSSSMPPPTQFPGPMGGQFYGDYIGLAVVNNLAYPIWSDTRSLDVFVCPGTATGPGNPPRLCNATEPNGLTANDQEIYTALVAVP
jgi:hypothetical protein